MDIIVYFLLRLVCVLIKLLPVSFQVWVMGLSVRKVTKNFSRFDRIARKNLRLAFPSKTESWYDQVIANSHWSLAQLFVDFLRLEILDREWINSHVDGSALDQIEKTSPINLGRGVIFASGHLGSFELLGHSLAALRKPICFVARDFHNKQINRWWQSKRQLNGNEIISNRGAYKPILQRLEGGLDVAIPIDQNVKQEQAVFVDWFGHLAATSTAPARAALKTGAALFVVCMANESRGHYRIRLESCDYSDIYCDSSLSKKEKVKEITQRISNSFCQMILERPEQWFWLHRRWKSSPSGDIRRDLYDIT